MNTKVVPTAFHAAERWAWARDCRRIEVETQNINVPACRFYARHGCELGAINRLAYKNLPDEVELLWFKNVGARLRASAG